MLPPEVIVRTKVARPGMTVEHVLRECYRARVQSLPYYDSGGNLVGRVTLKHIVNRSVIPPHLVELAHLVGREMHSFHNMERRLGESFSMPVEEFVQEPHASVFSDTHLMKALAIMEHYDTSYLFVVDNGEYQGTVTIQGIAAWMLELVSQSADA